MIHTCEKCGKKTNVSIEQLEETAGVIVCPQCLATVALPGFATQRNRPQREPASTPTRTISFKEATPPPPRRVRRDAVATMPPPRPAVKPRSRALSATKRTKRQQEPSGKGMAHALAHPPHPLGCLWRSVAITLLLLALYVIMGLIFSL